MQSKNDADGHWQNYSEYSKTLRSWLVAYGIGGPVLFLTNKEVSSRVADSGDAGTIVLFFLIGVGLQILGSVINKWAAWYMYRGADNPVFRSTTTYKRWECVNRQSWIDILVDVVSLLAFVVATWVVLGIFLTPTVVA